MKHRAVKNPMLATVKMRTKITVEMKMRKKIIVETKVRMTKDNKTRNLTIMKRKGQIVRMRTNHKRKERKNNSNQSCF